MGAARGSGGQRRWSWVFLYVLLCCGGAWGTDRDIGKRAVPADLSGSDGGGAVFAVFQGLRVFVFAAGEAFGADPENCGGKCEESRDGAGGRSEKFGAAVLADFPASAGMLVSLVPL